MSEPAIKKALEYQAYFMHDAKLRHKYELQEKAIRDYNSGMLAAKEEGIQEEKIQNAINFLKLGIDIETVAKGVNLSVEEIEKIKQQYL
ncbi:hypothetical protein [Megamonas hypermegale]|uniref:hypothetical protein n=1 Tax=Megamonas hypermegale TaxID=158847 RepID=UPI001957FC9F|nr:hypothetical protein [Megamonas hypermegale]MBM6760863.1 hypothetical protein [Megamonas hypermegale]